LENHVMQDATSPVASVEAAASSEISSSVSATPAQAVTQLNRDQILDATWQCLREQGYDATTIRRIAARLDCAIGSIYRYYRDKHDLLSCVTQRPYEAVAQAVEEGQPFATTAETYAQLAAQEPQSYFLMFWLANQKLQGQSQADATFQLPEVVARIIEGWARQVGGKQAATQRWAVLHGAMTAGADPLAMLQSMGLIGPTRKIDPDDRTAQQIVTVMRTPPLPRHLRQQLAAAAEPKPVEVEAVETPAGNAAPAAAPAPVREDVCLL